MGAWGTAIFSDDTASDVRSEFKDHIGDGLTPEQATDAMLKEYESSLSDPDDGPPFWLGLAATQWNLGRLLPSVRDRALQIIDSGEDLRRFEEDPKLVVKRREVLEKLREQLLSPPPAPKKVPRRIRETCDWPIGSIVTYRRLDGRLVWLRVTEYHIDRGGKAPVVEWLDWSGEDLPRWWQFKKLLGKVNSIGSRVFAVFGANRKEFPADRVTLTTHNLGPSTDRRPSPGIGITRWHEMDAYLDQVYRD